jgi:hypothetical protein
MVEILPPRRSIWEKNLGNIDSGYTGSSVFNTISLLLKFSIQIFRSGRREEQKQSNHFIIKAEPRKKASSFHKPFAECRVPQKFETIHIICD